MFTYGFFDGRVTLGISGLVVVKSVWELEAEVSEVL